jgi:hypothetical protein
MQQNTSNECLLGHMLVDAAVHTLMRAGNLKFMVLWVLRVEVVGCVSV